jgi:hypothetical protein
MDQEQEASSKDMVEQLQSEILDNQARISMLEARVFKLETP